MSHQRRMGPRLSALLDGDLGRLSAFFVRRHLRRCAPCQQQAQALSQQAGALRLLAQPASADDERRCLAGWLALRTRLRQEGKPLAQPRRPPRLVVAVALGTVVVLPLLPRGALRRLAHLDRPAVDADARIGISEDAFRQAEEPYQRALAQLHGLAQQRVALWTPAQRQRYDHSLRQLQEASRGAAQRARSHPADAEAQALLYGAYQREIDFLQTALYENDRGTLFAAPAGGLVPVGYSGGRP